MASYVETTLASGERILLQTRIALRSFVPQFVIAGAAFVAGIIFAVAGKPVEAGLFLILAALTAIGPVLRFMTSELAITNRRVVAKFGVISTRTLEIRLEKIESISVQQDILGRVLDYGSIVVAGTGGSRDTLPNIPSPIRFRTEFANAMESAGGR